jgi:hypothetical protein
MSSIAAPITSHADPPDRLARQAVLEMCDSGSHHHRRQRSARLRMQCCCTTLHCRFNGPAAGETCAWFQRRLSVAECRVCLPLFSTGCLADAVANVYCSLGRIGRRLQRLSSPTPSRWPRNAWGYGCARLRDLAHRGQPGHRVAIRRGFLSAGPSVAGHLARSRADPLVGRARHRRRRWKCSPNWSLAR